MLSAYMYLVLLKKRLWRLWGMGCTWSHLALCLVTRMSRKHILFKLNARHFTLFLGSKPVMGTFANGINPDAMLKMSDIFY